MKAARRLLVREPTFMAPFLKFNQVLIIWRRPICLDSLGLNSFIDSRWPLLINFKVLNRALACHLLNTPLSFKWSLLCIILKRWISTERFASLMRFERSSRYLSNSERYHTRKALTTLKSTFTLVFISSDNLSTAYLLEDSGKSLNSLTSTLLSLSVSLS
jgi:hypothetical protein